MALQGGHADVADRLVRTQPNLNVTDKVIITRTWSTLLIIGYICAGDDLHGLHSFYHMLTGLCQQKLERLILKLIPR